VNPGNESNDPSFDDLKDKEKSMGRKGVSKRKPKKTTPHSNIGISNFNDVKNSERSPVQSLVNDKSAPLNRGGTNPSAGSGKTQKKKKH